LHGKMKIGLITDGKYGERACKNFKRFFETEWILIPDIPTSAILDEDIELDIPDWDLYVSYVRHPDIILIIAEIQKPLILGITPGWGLYLQAKQINPNVISPRTMCSLEPNTKIPEVDQFAKFFGRPHFQVEMGSDRTIKKVSVLRSSPCGSSGAGAKFMENKELTIQNMRDFALTVCHECRAPRFGHTCDKEISGIIHILSFLESIEQNYSDKLNEDLRNFIQQLKEEYKARTGV